MAQLQEKIRIEVQAKEELTKTYEYSLNKGVHGLNEETRNLQDNPLVREISLIVAQELQNRMMTHNEASYQNIIMNSEQNARRHNRR